MRGATRMESEQPTTVGCVVASDPFRNLSWDYLTAAVDSSIEEP